MIRPQAAARSVGLAAEQAACDHLRCLGYVIIERNYSCRYGEIDIVAREGGCLVFVEVRYRGPTSRESPGESLTWRKLSRLRRAIRDYLFRRFINEGAPVRIDVCLFSPDAPAAGTQETGLETAIVPGLGPVRVEVVRDAVHFG